MPHQIEQILAVAPVVDAEGRVEADGVGVLTQQARTDRMEGAGPAQARWRARRAHGGGDDALGAALHLGGGPAREGQQQDAAGIGAVDDQVGDAVRQGAGLAGARTGNHQQGPGDVRAVRSDAMLDGTALRGIEGLKIGHEQVQPCWSGPRLSMIRCPGVTVRRSCDGCAMRPIFCAALRRSAFDPLASSVPTTDHHDWDSGHCSNPCADTARQFSSWRRMDLMACVSLRRQAGSYCAPPPNVLKPVTPHDALARAMEGASHNWRFRPASLQAWRGPRTQHRLDATPVGCERKRAARAWRR